MTNIKHSSNTSSWYTPIEIIRAAKLTMGSIDLDPASSSLANINVGATTYYDEQANGLIQPWSGNVWLNPPGGKLAGKSLAKLFWQKLMSSPNVKQCIFLAFSIELLQTSQLSDVPSACKYTMCIPKRRLSFIDVQGNVVKGNTHASAIIYVGKKVKSFAKNFSQFGQLVTKYK